MIEKDLTDLLSEARKHGYLALDPKIITHWQGAYIDDVYYIKDNIWVSASEEMANDNNSGAAPR